MDCWDSYKDVRSVFFESFRKNWKDLPYPVILACNSAMEDERTVGEVVVCDSSLTDSKRHLRALDRANSEYVLLIVEDGLITKPVNSQRIEEILDYMDEKQLNFCKMVPFPSKKGKKIQDFPNAKYISKRQAYGINYLCGIYRVSYLKTLLDSECKDSWEIEEMLLRKAAASEKGYYEDKILVTDDPLNIVFCVEKGKWSHWAKKYIKKNGYMFNSSRESWSLWHDFVAGIKHFISNILPIKLRFKIKKVLMKFGMKFATKQ